MPSEDLDVQENPEMEEQDGLETGGELVKKANGKNTRLKRLNGRYGRTRGLFARKDENSTEFADLPAPECSSSGTCSLDCCKEGGELSDPDIVAKLRDKARQIHELDRGSHGLDNYFTSCLRVRSTSETQGNAFGHLVMLQDNKKLRCSYCRSIANLPADVKPHNFGHGCPNYQNGLAEIGKKLPYYVEYLLPSIANSRARLRVSKSYFMRLFIIGPAKMTNLIKGLHSEGKASKKRKLQDMEGGGVLVVPESTVASTKTDELRDIIAKQKVKIANLQAQVKDLKAKLDEKGA